MATKILVDKDHTQRVRDELVKVGMTKYGLLKSEARHLPEHIHEDEHIGGVVYGRYEKGSSMIVATDKRILVLDYKLFFQSTDEIKYDVVSGVSVNKQEGNAGVVLHTRLGDYKLRYVNLKCADHFLRYIQSMSVEMTAAEAVTPPKPTKYRNPMQKLASDARLFLSSHELTTLSTIDAEGNVHGAVVYYTADKNDNIFIVTKAGTEKAQDIETFHQVALTMYDVSTMQTLQISGIAHKEVEPKIKQMIEKKILRPRFKDGHGELPPILYIPAGDYEVICVKPLTYKFNDYNNH